MVWLECAVAELILGLDNFIEDLIFILHYSFSMQTFVNRNIVADLIERLLLALDRASLSRRTPG